MFKKMLQKTAAVIQFEKDFEAALEIADPLEKLLKLESMNDRITKLRQRGGGVVANSLLWGMGVFFAGMAMSNPFVAFGGIGIMLTGVGGTAILSDRGQDGKALSEVIAAKEKSRDEIKKSVLSEEGVRKIAQSPFFQEGMQRFPDLKEIFLLATAKEKVLSLPPRPGVIPSKNHGSNGFNL